MDEASGRGRASTVPPRRAVKLHRGARAGKQRRLVAVPRHRARVHPRESFAGPSPGAGGTRRVTAPCRPGTRTA